MAASNSADIVDNKLDGFDVVQANYKTVGNHGIRSDLLIPKSPFQGKRPVIVFFHGGGLVRDHIAVALRFEVCS